MNNWSPIRFCYISHKESPDSACVNIPSPAILYFGGTDITNNYAFKFIMINFNRNFIMWKYIWYLGTLLLYYYRL